MGSFLNGNGGVLCFGCRPNGKGQVNNVWVWLVTIVTGRAYGIKLNRREEDNLRLMIDDFFKRIHPFVSPEKYRLVSAILHSII